MKRKDFLKALGLIPFAPSIIEAVVKEPIPKEALSVTGPISNELLISDYFVSQYGWDTGTRFGHAINQQNIVKQHYNGDKFMAWRGSGEPKTFKIANVEPEPGTCKFIQL